MNYILKKNLYITKACKKEPLYIDKNDYIVMFDKPIKDFNLNIKIWGFHLILKVIWLQ